MSHPLPLAIEVGQHLTYMLFGRYSINIDTIIETLVVMAIVLGLALYVRRVVTHDIPGRVQNVFEYLVDFVDNLVANNLGQHGPRIAPMLLALFVFIMLSNWLGLLPLPGIAKSPTADVNTPAALAVVVVMMVQVLAIRKRGFGGYLKHFTQPVAAMTPLEIIQEFVRMVSLTFRLFGNIFAGELLLLLIANLLPWWAIPIVNPLWVFFSILVGIIQAFIFTLLTVVYVALATAESH